MPEVDPRQRRRLYFWLATAAIAVRLVYFVDHSQSAFFHVPILDEAFYESVALALLEGRDVAAINPAFRPLLYPAFLAAAYGLGETLGGDGWGHPAALVLQHLLGVATTLLVAALALRLYRRLAPAALAGAFYLLAGPPLFYEGELLITTLFCFFVTLLLWLATHCRPLGAAHASGSSSRNDQAERVDGASRADRVRTLWPWLAAGAVLALAVQARPNALVLVAAFLVVPWLFADGRGAPPTAGRARALGRTVLPAACLLAVLALGLVAAAAWQASHFGRFQVLPGSGEVNLYLGNKQGADGMVPRQDQHAAYGNLYRDSVQLFSIRAYREATGDTTPEPDPRTVGRFWLARTVDEIRAAPVAWLGLMARKTTLLLWHREIPNNKGYALVAREESRLLGALPVRIWWLLGLATLGIVAGWRASDLRNRDRRPNRETPEGDTPDRAQTVLAWILAFALLHGASVVLFFVNGRFRIPLWPMLAVLAGGGAALLFGWLVDAVRGDRTRPAGRGKNAVALVSAAAVMVVSLLGWPGVVLPGEHRDYFFRSYARFEKGDLEGARADAERAVELEPSDPAAQFQLGTVALAQDDLEAAELHITRATRLEPGEPRVFNNLGVVFEKRGQVNAAYTAYSKVLQLDPDYTPALTNMALLELRAGALGRARQKIERAERLGDRSVQLQCARAFLELREGRNRLGRLILAGAMERNEELTLRLAEENQRALVLERAGL